MKLFWKINKIFYFYKFLDKKVKNKHKLKRFLYYLLINIINQVRIL